MIRINFSISKILILIRFHSIQPFLRFLIPSLSSFIKFFVYFHQKSNTRVRIQIIECEKLSKSTQLHTCLTSFLRFKFFLNFDSFKKKIMQFDVGDKMCWWQLKDGRFRQFLSPTSTILLYKPRIPTFNRFANVRKSLSPLSHKHHNVTNITGTLSLDRFLLLREKNYHMAWSYFYLDAIMQNDIIWGIFKSAK